MSDRNPALTDDMVERAARAYCRAGATSVDPGALWLLITEAERASYRECTRVALEAALAGRVPVALPEPDGTSYEGDPMWCENADFEDAIFAGVRDGHPVVDSSFEAGGWSPETAEQYGLRLLAAAREARRLAEEGQR